MRQRLDNLKRDQHLGKISQSQYTTQAVEILTALRTLGENLSAEEVSFVEKNKSAALADFEKVEKADMGVGSKQAVLNAAGAQIKKAKD